MEHPHFKTGGTTAQYFSSDSAAWQLPMNVQKDGLGFYGKLRGYTKTEWENHFNNGRNVYLEEPVAKKK